MSCVAQTSAEVGWRQALVHGGGNAASCGAVDAPEVTPGPGSYTMRSSFDAKERKAPQPTTPRKKAANAMLCGPAAADAPHYMRPLQRGDRTAQRDSNQSGSDHHHHHHHQHQQQQQQQQQHHPEVVDDVVLGVLSPADALGAVPPADPSQELQWLRGRSAELQRLLEERDRDIASYPPMTQDEMRLEANLITQRALSSCPNL